MPPKPAAECAEAGTSSDAIGGSRRPPRKEKKSRAIRKIVPKAAGIKVKRKPGRPPKRVKEPAVVQKISAEAGKLMASVENAKGKAKGARPKVTPQTEALLTAAGDVPKTAVEADEHKISRKAVDLESVELKNPLMAAELKTSVEAAATETSTSLDTLKVIADKMKIGLEADELKFSKDEVEAQPKKSMEGNELTNSLQAAERNIPIEATTAKLLENSEVNSSLKATGIPEKPESRLDADELKTPLEDVTANFTTRLEISDVKAHLKAVAGDPKTNLEANKFKIPLEAVEATPKTNLVADELKTPLEVLETKPMTGWVADGLKTPLEAVEAKHLEASERNTLLKFFVSEPKTCVQTAQLQTHLEAVATETRQTSICSVAAQEVTVNASNVGIGSEVAGFKTNIGAVNSDTEKTKAAAVRLKSKQLAKAAPEASKTTTKRIKRKSSVKDLVTELQTSITTKPQVGTETNVEAMTDPEAVPQNTTLASVLKTTIESAASKPKAESAAEPDTSAATKPQTSLEAGIELKNFHTCTRTENSDLKVDTGKKPKKSGSGRRSAGLIGELAAIGEATNIADTPSKPKTSTATSTSSGPREATAVFSFSGEDLTQFGASVHDVQLSAGKAVAAFETETEAALKSAKFVAKKSKAGTGMHGKAVSAGIKNARRAKGERGRSYERKKTTAAVTTAKPRRLRSTPVRLERIVTDRGHNIPSSVQLDSSNDDRWAIFSTFLISIVLVAGKILLYSIFFVIMRSNFGTLESSVVDLDP
jgi:hypothetical protein